MAGFYIYTTPSKTLLRKTAKAVEKWFEEHPRRRVCNTDLFEHTKVRRGKVLEDLYVACNYPLPKKRKKVKKKAKKAKKRK